MSSITLRKVRSEHDSAGDSMKVTLFADQEGRPCGWYIGPVRYSPGGIDMAYLPRSDRTLASVAIVRAIEAAESLNVPVCVIDPDDLWSRAWHA